MMCSQSNKSSPCTWRLTMMTDRRRIPHKVKKIDSCEVECKCPNVLRYGEPCRAPNQAAEIDATRESFAKCQREGNGRLSTWCKTTVSDGQLYEPRAQSNAVNNRQQHLLDDNLIVEEDKAVQRMLHRLQVMEAEQGAYLKETDFVVKKQKQTIRDLEDERREMLIKLAKWYRDEENGKDVVALLNKKGGIHKQIKKEKGKIDILNTVISTTNREITVKTKAVSDVTSTTDKKRERLKRAIPRLEMKLHETNRMLSNVVTDSLKKKRDILYLVDQRSRFSDQYMKVHKEYLSKSSLYTEILKNVVNLHKGTNMNMTKLKTFKLKCEENLSTRLSEIEDTERQLNEQRELHNFFVARGKDREYVEDTASIEAAKERKNNERKRQLLNSYDYTLNKIYRFFKEDDAAKLLQRCEDNNAEQISLVKLITKLNEEVESERNCVYNMEEMIRKNTLISDRLLRSYEGELTEWKHMKNEGESHVTDGKECMNSDSEILEDIFKEITKVFELAKCSKESFINDLGRNEAINTQNIMAYMRVLEERIDKVIDTANMVTLKQMHDAGIALSADSAPILLKREIKDIPNVLIPSHERVSFLANGTPTRLRNVPLTLPQIHTLIKSNRRMSIRYRSKEHHAFTL